MADASADQTSSRADTAPLITQILALLGKVAERLDSQEGENWQWLAQHSSNPLIIEILRDMTLTSMRVLNGIGQLEPVNGITISARAGVPKGTVSKVARRLVARKLVTTEFLPNNKKEILFRLTPLGRELVHLNHTFDEQMERGFASFLQGYDADELRLLARILQDATEASFLTLGLQSHSS